MDIWEKVESRSSDENRDKQTLPLVYFLRDVYEDETLSEDSRARQLVYDTAPTSYRGLLLSNIQMEPLGGGCWIATVLYDSTLPSMQNENVAGSPPPSPPSPPSPPAPTPPAATELLPSGFSFDISGVEEKRTQSKATISKTKRGGGVAPNNEQAIGVTVDGEVEGCSVIQPKFEWSVTIAFAGVTQAYLDVLSDLVGRTNHNAFYHWAAERLLFLGASGSSQNNGPLNITFKFLVGQHEVNIPICDGLIVPAKKAHEYLWVSYKNVTSGGKLTMQPDAAYVEKVYDTGFFANLEIGE